MPNYHSSSRLHTAEKVPGFTKSAAGGAAFDACAELESRQTPTVPTFSANFCCSFVTLSNSIRFCTSTFQKAAAMRHSVTNHKPKENSNQQDRSRYLKNAPCKNSSPVAATVNFPCVIDQILSADVHV